QNPGWTLGFTSCRRFSGFFRFHGTGTLEIVVDTEGLTLNPGESWQLEEYHHDIELPNRIRFARRIALNHPPIRPATPPTGWCSWDCFGPRAHRPKNLHNTE